MVSDGPSRHVEPMRRMPHIIASLVTVGFLVGLVLVWPIPEPVGVGFVVSTMAVGVIITHWVAFGVAEPSRRDRTWARLAALGAGLAAVIAFPLQGFIYAVRLGTDSIDTYYQVVWYVMLAALALLSTGAVLDVRSPDSPPSRSSLWLTLTGTALGALLFVGATLIVANDIV